MEVKVELFRRYFGGRMDVFAEQHPNGSYSKVERPEILPESRPILLKFKV